MIDGKSSNTSKTIYFSEVYGSSDNKIPYTSLMRWKYGMLLGEFSYTVRYREKNISDINISC